MDYMKLSCEDFLEKLSSSDPVPGGGSASAYVGAIGMALGSMVGNLTLGKKAYAEVQDEIKSLLEDAECVRVELMELVAADVEVFSKLSKVYSMPKDTEATLAARKEAMQIALKEASDVPLQIMQKCCEAIDIHERYAAIGTKNAISDVGVGVVCCKAALYGASLNIFINLKSIDDQDYRKQVGQETRRLLDEYGDLAETVFDQVIEALS